MKWMIASDIHGSAYYCRKLIEAFEEEKAGRLVLLGDILYHGPRNDLPKEYAPKAVAAMLNGMKDRLLCIRGNCDAEVDQMMLEFPILAEYAVIEAGNRLVYLTHGHIYNIDHPLPMQTGDMMIYGHTHIRMMEERHGIVFCNPGSVSIPKGDTPNSYMLMEDSKCIFKELC